MKRIGIIHVWQESNSFNPVATTLEDFRRWEVVRGHEVVGRFGDSEEIGGFLSGLGRRSRVYEPVGLLRAMAWPGGPLSKDALDWLLRALDESLLHAGALDGLLFSLHGALVAENEADADGALLERAREALGDRIPIVATLDCHAYLTSRMMRSADAILAYHTNPHVDRFETGRRGGRTLDMILEGATPASASERLPMIVTGELSNTFGEVLAPIFQRLGELERQEDVLSAAVLMTQPWLDVPELGWSTLVTMDADAARAAGLAGELADMCWSRRSNLGADAAGFLSADEAVAEALACPGKPVVVADGPDATNSGACGDSTHLLRAMIAREIPGGALTIMVDPDAVAHAERAGAGAAFEFAVGAKRDNVFSQPLQVAGQVVSVQRAKYVLHGHAADNLPIDMGTSATVRIGDVTLLLVEHPGPGSSPMMYRCVGLEPRDFKIVVVKSPAGFRADFEPFAAGILLTDSPGCASPHLEKMPFTKINRPLWPLDDIDDRRAVRWASKTGGG